MNKRNAKSREDNCPFVALLKNTLATYSMLVRLAIVKGPELTFVYAIYFV